MVNGAVLSTRFFSPGSWAPSPYDSRGMSWLLFSIGFFYWILQPPEWTYLKVYTPIPHHQNRKKCPFSVVEYETISNNIFSFINIFDCSNLSFGKKSALLVLIEARIIFIYSLWLLHPLAHKWHPFLLRLLLLFRHLVLLLIFPAPLKEVSTIGNVSFFFKPKDISVLIYSVLNESAPQAPPALPPLLPLL